MRAVPAKEPGSTGTAARSPSARPEVAVVVCEGLSLFEFGVACDVFGIDRSAEIGRPWYRLSTCAPRRGPVRTDAGLRLYVPHGLRPMRCAGTVLVPPTERPGRIPDDVLAELRRAHARGARLVALCTGAFVLAAAGLLDGRRATTHWAQAAQLARQVPTADVDPGALYVEDGRIFTSAGSAASIDLCLHVVRQDYGAEVATRLARELVVPLQREGDQAQYLDTPFPDVSAPDLFGETLEWARAHLDQAISVHELARRSAMSTRTFARRFKESVGATPYRWLLRQRVHQAQRLLETTDLPVDAVASSCGFCDASTLRKHFSAVTRTSPLAYRRTFRHKEAVDPQPVAFDA